MWPRKRSSPENDHMSLAEQEARGISILQGICARLDPKEVERTAQGIIDRMDAEADEVAARTVAGDTIYAPFFYVSDEQRAWLIRTAGDSGIKLLGMLDEAARDPRMLDQ